MSKEQREKYKDFLNNCFLLVATFLGVVLALYFTNNQAADDKKERAVNVLKLSYKSLENYYNFLNIGFVAVTPDHYLRGWKFNGRHPEIIVLKTYEIYYTITPYTYSDLISTDAGLSLILKAIEQKDTMTDEEFKRDMSALNFYLWSAAKHILWEISYQEGTLTEEELHLKLNDEHLKFQGAVTESWFKPFPVKENAPLILVDEAYAKKLLEP